MNLKSILLIAATAIAIGTAAGSSSAEVRDHRNGSPQGGVTVSCTKYNVLGQCMPRYCAALLKKNPDRRPGPACTSRDHR
jgi:hypothetical protein